jgi:hypothetical protein
VDDICTLPQLSGFIVSSINGEMRLVSSLREEAVKARNGEEEAEQGQKQMLVDAGHVNLHAV